MRTALILAWVLAGLSLIVAGFAAFLAVRVPAANVSPGQGSPGGPYSIVVNGEGEASAAPDVAYVTLGVDTPAPTAAAATDENARAMSGVIAAVKAQGVAEKDVRTQDFTVMPVYAQQRPGDAGAPPTITGYRVRNTARVTVEDVQNVGRVLDAGLQARANSAVGVQFAIKDTTTLQRQALGDAMRQARAKAEAIAASAGLRLTGPYTIIESAAQVPRPVAAAQPSAGVAATPIESGELSVTGHVQVAFQYAH